VVLATLDLGSVVLSIAALNFLGLADRPPATEWGAMLNDGRVYFRLHPHLMVLPGVCIFLLVPPQQRWWRHIRGQSCHSQVDERQTHGRV